VTQAAVSYAVRAVETDLGSTLFARGPRGVALTSTGERFHAEVTLALGHIRGSVERTRRSGGEAVTLSVSTAFAAWWVLPRLARLRADLPEVELRVLTTGRDLDVAAEGVALGVRYGRGVLPHYGRAALAPEVIFPAASPRYLSSLPRTPACAADLPGLALVHLEEPHRPCPTWADWLAAHGAPPPRPGGLRLNDYALAVQAALDGEGVILGWAHLVDPLVASGALAAATPERWRTGVDFMLVWAGEPGPAARRVRDWLLALPEPG